MTGNSQSIVYWKDRIMMELQNDAEIVSALNLNEDEDAEDLVGVRLFPYHFIPDTEEVVKTYILVEISIPEQRYDRGSTLFSKPTIAFTVLAHKDDMLMKESGQGAVRTDYITMLLDKKYNDNGGFGFKQLKFLYNEVTSTSSMKYRARTIAFEGVDLDNSICEG